MPHSLPGDGCGGAFPPLASTPRATGLGAARTSESCADGLWKVLSSCQVVSGDFHPLLKCLKRFIVLLPDAAVWVCDDLRLRAALSYDANRPCLSPTRRRSCISSGRGDQMIGRPWLVARPIRKASRSATRDTLVRCQLLISSPKAIKLSGLTAGLLRPFALFSGSVPSRHTRSSAGFTITTCVFEFSVHTGAVEISKIATISSLFMASP